MTAFEEEARLDDVPSLDPNIPDERLAERIAGLAREIEALAYRIGLGPRDMQQLVDLDDLADALDAAMRMEDARKAAAPNGPAENP